MSREGLARREILSAPPAVRDPWGVSCVADTPTVRYDRRRGVGWEVSGLRHSAVWERRGRACRLCRGWFAFWICGQMDMPTVAWMLSLIFNAVEEI